MTESVGRKRARIRSDESDAADVRTLRAIAPPYLGRARSGRQSGSTFRAPTFQYLSSAFGCHPCTESVIAFAPQVAGLKRSLHGKLDAGYDPVKKVLSKTKRCAERESGELYARHAMLSIAAA